MGCVRRHSELSWDLLLYPCDKSAAWHATSISVRVVALDNIVWPLGVRSLDNVAWYPVQVLWLHERFPEKPWKPKACVTASNGHLDMLILLNDLCQPDWSQCTLSAATCGHLHVVGCFCTGQSICSGSVNALKILNICFTCHTIHSFDSLDLFLQRDHMNLGILWLISRSLSENCIRLYILRQQEHRSWSLHMLAGACTKTMPPVLCISSASTHNWM